MADVSGLDVLGGCGDEFHRFGFLQMAVDVVAAVVQFIGEVLQILRDVVSGLAALHIIMVEIPVEMCLSLLLQSLEELLFSLLHHVESHKQVVLFVEMQLFVGGHLSV